jgi:hypothetical protein
MLCCLGLTHLATTPAYELQPAALAEAAKTSLWVPEMAIRVKPRRLLVLGLVALASVRPRRPLAGVEHDLIFARARLTESRSAA